MAMVKRILKGNALFLLLLLAVILFHLRFDVCFIRTGSMEPTLQVGALVLIDPHKDPRIGDIAAYRRGSTLVIHRVIGKEADGYVFKGDSNPGADPFRITQEELCGAAICHTNLAAPLIRFFLR